MLQVGDYIFLLWLSLIYLKQKRHGQVHFSSTSSSNLYLFIITARARRLISRKTKQNKKLEKGKKKNDAFDATSLIFFLHCLYNKRK